MYLLRIRRRGRPNFNYLTTQASLFPIHLKRRDRPAYPLGMLPEDFKWRFDDRYGHHWLLCNGREVALVNKVSEGKWLMGVNRQRWSGNGRGYTGTLSHAKRMVERWATVNAQRLRREVLDQKLRSPPTGDPRLSRAEQRIEHRLRS